jgi:hypothetical protein
MSKDKPKNGPVRRSSNGGCNKRRKNGGGNYERWNNFNN